MNKKVIINADDFGYTPAVTYGIIESFKKGIVSSTTALTVSPYFNEAMTIARAMAPELPIGLHLALTLNDNYTALPKEKVSTLLGADGCFNRQGEFNQKVETGKLDFDQVALEWEAQFLRFLATGYTPTHIDSHHHVHRFEGVFQVAEYLATKYSIPIRTVDKVTQVKQPCRTYVDFYGEGVSLEGLTAIFEDIKNSKEVICGELSVHPSFIDEPLKGLTSYCEPRLRELSILTSPEGKAALEKSGLILTSFKAL